MKNKFSVIEIHSRSRLIALLIIAFGILCSFLISPAWVIMKIWNMTVTQNGMPAINMLQGGLLWMAGLLCIYMGFRDTFSVKVQKGAPMSPAELKELMAELPDIQEEAEKEEIKK